MPDDRFKKLMTMDYQCVLVESTGVMFNMELARKVSTMYSLPFKRTTSRHPSLHTFLQEAFDSEGSRHEFLAHLIVEHEILESRGRNVPPRRIELVEFADI